MEFEDLPVEMVLKIFSYLPQDFLEVISQVSQRWKMLALDPSLYREVRIEPWHFDNPQQMRQTLERATMLRTLQITADAADFEIVSSASTGLRLLQHLEIPGSGLSHRAMPAILQHCESLTTIALWGEHMLTANDVRAMEALPSLKTLVIFNHLGIREDVLQQICRSCPRLEGLELNSKHITRSESWDYIEGLIHLRALSVSIISTAGLVHVSKSACLAMLEVGILWNENDVSMAQALEGFLQLRSLTVIVDCGQGWLDQRFRAPPLLETFEVPGLAMDEQQFIHLIVSFMETLQCVHIDVSSLPDESLRALPLCQNVECLSIEGLGGKTIVFSILCRLPKLIRASLHIVADPGCAVHQLMSIVNVHDTSPRGNTRLLLDILSKGNRPRDKISRAAYAFIGFLALNTSMTMQHIFEFEEELSACAGCPGD